MAIKLILAGICICAPVTVVSAEKTHILTDALMQKIEVSKTEREREGLFATLKKSVINPDQYQGDQSLVHYTTHQSYVKTTKLCLEHWGHLTDKPTACGFTPLHYAVIAKNAPLVQLLLQHHAEPNTQTNKGFTPLMFALLRYQISDHENTCIIIQALLNHGADIHLPDGTGKTIVDYVLAIPNNDLQRALLKIFAKQESNWVLSTLMHRASHSYTALLHIIALLTHYQIDPTSFVENGDALIHLAARQGNLKALELFISRWQDLINARNACGETPLHCAIQAQQELVVRALCAGTEYGRCADITITDSKGKTALQYAQERGYLRIVVLLTPSSAVARIYQKPPMPTPLVAPAPPPAIVLTQQNEQRCACLLAGIATLGHHAYSVIKPVIEKIKQYIEEREKRFSAAAAHTAQREQKLKRKAERRFYQEHRGR